jgi:hypothetical protein
MIRFLMRKAQPGMEIHPRKTLVEIYCGTDVFAVSERVELDRRLSVGQRPSICRQLEKPRPMSDRMPAQESPRAWREPRHNEHSTHGHRCQLNICVDWLIPVVISAIRC